MALVSERFARFAARRGKIEALASASQNDLTTTYKYKPDTAESNKLYKQAARKAGPSPHDVMTRMDSKAILEFAKKNGLIK